MKITEVINTKSPLLGGLFVTLCAMVFTTACATANDSAGQAHTSATDDGPIIQGSRSFQFSENNNNVYAVQRADKDPQTPGDVKIEFYGHMAFKITSPAGVRMVIDPWRNDPTGAFGVWYPKEFPELEADIAMSSHAHFDHDALYRVHASMNLERMAGEFALGDVKITGVAEKHQCHAPGEINWTAYLKKAYSLDLDSLCPNESSMSWDNVIYIIETGGVRIGFWGDSRPDLSEFAKKQLANLDVLIMNIDGSEHILSYKQVDTVLSTFKPKAVIPGHYLSGDAVLESSTLKSADEWVDAQKDVVKLKTATLEINPAMLKGLDRRVYYFGPHYKTD